MPEIQDALSEKEKPIDPKTMKAIYDTINCFAKTGRLQRIARGRFLVRPWWERLAGRHFLTARRAGFALVGEFTDAAVSGADPSRHDAASQSCSTRSRATGSAL
jgi:hypothetical protein